MGVWSASKLVSQVFTFLCLKSVCQIPKYIQKGNFMSAMHSPCGHVQLVGSITLRHFLFLSSTSLHSKFYFISFSMLSSCFFLPHNHCSFPLVLSSNNGEKWLYMISPSSPDGYQLALEMQMCGLERLCEGDREREGARKGRWAAYVYPLSGLETPVCCWSYSL